MADDTKDSKPPISDEQKLASVFASLGVPALSRRHQEGRLAAESRQAVLDLVGDDGEVSREATHALREGLAGRPRQEKGAKPKRGPVKTKPAASKRALAKEKPAGT